MNPFFANLKTDKAHFILHIVSTSGVWDHRDVGHTPQSLPRTIPRQPLGSVETTEVSQNVFILHLYAARGKRNRDNIHPICFCYFGKCLMTIKDLDRVNCALYVPERTCRLNGANPGVVREMITAVLPTTPVTFF